MLSIDKTVEILDALQYCNKHIIGIEKDYVSHFYKIKHSILAHIYKKPHIVEGHTLKIDGIELQDECKLISILVENQFNHYQFHVPICKKTCKQFGLTGLDEICISPYQSSEKVEGDQNTWMKYYVIVKEIAYRWGELNSHEDKMKQAVKHPNEWKQNWPMFASAFNKRFKGKYIIREKYGAERRCEIVRVKDNRVMYDIFKFKVMKGNTYINLMNRIAKNIKWH